MTRRAEIGKNQFVPVGRPPSVPGARFAALLPLALRSPGGADLAFPLYESGSQYAIQHHAERRCGAL